MCGGEVVQRSDDEPAAVRNRLRVYREQTAPLIEYYRRRDLLVGVDGAGSVEEIFSRITRALGHDPA
jgi:adenylate kinase